MNLAMPPVASAALIPEGSVPEGSTVTMDCSAFDGNIPINYTWTNPNGVIIANQSRFQLRNAKPRDYGVYVCTVTNIIGTHNTTIEVLYPGMYILL